MKKSKRDILDLESFFPYQLSVSQLSVSRSLAEIYGKQFNMSRPEWRVMAALGESQPQCANDIGLKTNMDKVQTSRAIARMVRNGLVDKQPDPKDGRSHLLAFTTKGQAAYDEIVPQMRQRADEIFSCLSRPEITGLMRTLDKLRRQANN